MYRYQFTGTVPETFSSIATETGTLDASPGDVIDLDSQVDHPRLRSASRKKSANKTGSVVDGRPDPENVESSAMADTPPESEE